MTLYATLADAKANLRADTTTDDNTLLRFLRILSRRVDKLFGTRYMEWAPYFMPSTESRRYLVTSGRVNSTLDTFRFGDPLLSLTAATVGDTTLTINTDVETWPQNVTPARMLRLKGSSTYSWYGYCTSDGSPLEVVITGIWGYHHDWANAWASVDTLSANINASVTSLTVSDIDGTDLYGLTPRISAGNVLKIGTEYLEVTATNTTTNVATVRRGILGTTAAAHTSGDAVATFQVYDSVKHAVANQAAKMYAKRGAYESTQITDIGTIQFPADFMAEFRNIMMEMGYD